MLNVMRIRSKWGALLLGIMGALLLAGSGAALSAILPATTGTLVGSTRTFDLWAKTGTATFYTGGPTVTIWGYADSAAGAATLPGPMLIANQNETVVVNLHNTLPEASAILFQGQALAPDTTGAPALTGTKTYSFTAGSPGSFLYEAGLLPNAQHQTAMGLYGALIVRPAGAAGQAYGDAATAFTDEALVLVSEIDPALNNIASIPPLNRTPANFDLRNYAPKYFLINGKAYPGTAPIDVTTPVPPAGSKVLLRYVNAGIQHHSMGVLGLRQVFVGKGGSVLPTLNHNVAAETLAPGQTGDAIATIAAATTLGSKFAVYDAALMLHNNGALGYGGMLTFVAVGTGAPGNTGPTTSSVTLTPSQTATNVSVLLNASISDAATGGSNVTAAEYFIDTTGAAGTGSAMTVAPAVTVTASATIPASTVTGLANGNHNVYVHGRDALGAWGPFAVAVLKVDRVGPATTLLTLTPDTSGQGANAVAVGITASANDTLLGGSNVTAAEYTIDGGAAVPMTVTPTAPAMASLSASIPVATINGLATGDHNVAVRSRDALLNWGPVATAVLHVVVVTAGPSTSGVSVLPDDANPGFANNGARPLSPGQPVLRVTATMTSAGSTVSGAEGFIDATPANTVRGFPFLPSDGVFNAASEAGFADVPLTTINALTPGNHTISVRGKDAAGNWGTFASATLLIDKTAPTFTSIALAPNPTLGAASVTMTVSGANDPLVAGLASGVAGGEYWIDTAAPAPGGGTPFIGLTPSIPVGALAAGVHTVGARIRDAAGNWSAATASATVSVVPDLIFANGFDTGGAPWGWTSRSTTDGARLNATATAAMASARGLQAQGSNTNYVQFNFGSAANPATATYDARFYFNPHGNTGTNQDILVARTTGGTTVFRVRYRWNGGSPQVQIQVGTGTGNAAWTGITNGAFNRIEVVWQSGGTLQLFVGGALVANQSLTATATSVGQVRLGSVTTGGSGTLEYFDAFSSKRSATPYGP